MRWYALFAFVTRWVLIYSSASPPVPAYEPTSECSADSAFLQTSAHAVQQTGLQSRRAEAGAGALLVAGLHKEWIELEDVAPNGMNVSLAIPAVPEDFEALHSVLVPSIQEQTLPPNEVVVALSNSTELQARRLESDLRRSLPAVRHVAVSVVERMAYAGENRNRAAGLCTSDLVAFFDADDAMHPRRLEILAHVFKHHNPKVLLHGYSPGVKDVTSLPARFEVIGGRYIAEHGSAALGAEERYRVHQGQPAVARRVFDEVRERPLPRGQDVRFLKEVIAKYGPRDDTIMYVGLPLSRFGNYRTGR